MAALPSTLTSLPHVIPSIHHSSSPAAPAPSLASGYSLPKIPDSMGVLRSYDYTVQKILTLNLCFFDQFVKNPALEACLGLSARTDKIIRMLLSESPDVVLLQEGREGSIPGSFLSIIMKICDATKMFPIFQHNDADTGSFIHVTLFNANKYFHQSSDRFYARARPEDRNSWGNEAGNGFVRQSTVNTFYMKKWEEIKPGMWAEVPDYKSCPFAINNQHLGTNLKERRLHTQVTIEEMNRRYPAHHVISAGDLNPLVTPEAGSVDTQLEIYNKVNWMRITVPPYVSQHGIPVTGSFGGFPRLDPWAKAELAKTEGLRELTKYHFGHQLDHGFYRRKIIYRK